MQHPGTDIVFHGPWWGRVEQTMFVNVSLMTGTVVSHNFEILAYEVIRATIGVPESTKFIS